MDFMSACLHKRWQTSEERQVSFSLMESIGRDICIRAEIPRASVHAAHGCVAQMASGSMVAVLLRLRRSPLALRVLVSLCPPSGHFSL